MIDTFKFIRTWRHRSEGGGTSVHLDGISDSYTLCGLDTAGDDRVHAKPPQELQGVHRITCPDCLRVIEEVERYLRFKKQK